MLNGCTDNSYEIAKKLESKLNNFLKVLNFNEKIGKGGAILEGLKASTAEYVCYADVDCAVPPSEVKKLYNNIGKYDCIIGSRHIKGSKIFIKQPLLRRVAGRTFNFICRSLFGFNYKDTQCGGKIVKKSTIPTILKQVKDTGWAFDVDLLVTLYNNGFSTKEFPINWYHDDNSKIKLFSDGFKMFLSLLEIKKNQHGIKFQKVLFLQHHYIYQGTFVRAAGFAKKLATRERHVYITCINDKVKYTTSYETLDNNPYITTIKLPRFFTQSSYVDILFRTPFAIWIAIKSRYEILYAFALGMPTNSIPSLFFKIFRHNNIIVDWDDLWHNGYGRYTGRIGNFLFYLFERLTLKFLNPKSVTCVSPFLFKMFKDEGVVEKNINIIGNGVNGGVKNTSLEIKDELKLKYNIPKETKVLISVGNTYGKSFENLIEAFKLAIIKDSDLKLYLLGSFMKGGQVGKEIESVIKKNRELFLSKITILGHIPYEDYQSYLKLATVAILPMEDTNIDRARFPIRLGDYVKYQLPIVSNATGVVEDILKKYDYGLVTDVKDLNKFSENIIECANNYLDYYKPELAEEILKNEFNWDKNSEKVFNIFRSYTN